MFKKKKSCGNDQNSKYIFSKQYFWDLCPKNNELQLAAAATGVGHCVFSSLSLACCSSSADDLNQGSATFTVTRVIPAPFLTK